MHTVSACQVIDQPTAIYCPVHEKHIADALAQVPRKGCPVHRALQWGVPCNVIVTVGELSAIFHVYDRPMQGRHSGTGLVAVGFSNLSPEVREFIRRFDAGEPVEPFHLTAEIEY